MGRRGLILFNSHLKENGLKSKKEVQQALLELLKPLEWGLLFETDDNSICETEAVFRPLWGLIPFLAGGGVGNYIDLYLLPIKQGTDPNHPKYWGQVVEFDQVMAGMATIGVALCLIKDQLLNHFTSQEQKYLYEWLRQINDCEMPKNNELFLRILVNLGFKNCQFPIDEHQMEQDLIEINSYYLSNGWYADGKSNQIDYYVSFSIHFYSLIYLKVVGNNDEIYAPLFRARAVEFAQSFRSFFANNGEAVPFGRGMSYRFAQSAFWGALAFANLEALPWGEIKHLCLQNLRHWFKQDIFSANGELTQGYYYPNVLMAERADRFGSPYWALKSFIFLALPEDHPFWLAKEQVGEISNHLLIPEARAIVTRDAEGRQVQMFTVGQTCKTQDVYAEAIYEKFVYSSSFGFSVSKGVNGLNQGAFDNTLSVSEQDNYFRVRHGVEEYGLKERLLYSIWKPWKDVSIRTYIIPLMPWHIRIHFISTERPLTLADGGFAIDVEGETGGLQTETEVAYCKAHEISGIVNLIGDQTSEFIEAESKTNTHYRKTVIPTLKFDCGPGKYVLASAVLGAVCADGKRLWMEDRPYIETNDDEALLVIKMGKQRLSLIKSSRKEKYS